MRAPTASPVSRATFSTSPTICSARSMRCRPRPRNRPDPGLKALIEGVELTERSLLNALEKNGVKKFDPAGEKFDPNFQQAMYEVPDPSVPAGTVVQVVQAGYMIGERVLRPALVAVSKGGAKAGGRQRQRAEQRGLTAIFRIVASSVETALCASSDEVLPSWRATLRAS